MNHPRDTLTDFITGRTVADVGAESHRQQVERLLVEQKKFAPQEIGVDVPIEVALPDGVYRSRVDLTVKIDGQTAMVIKCAAGSLGSREREVLAAARLLEARPVPLAAVSDGQQTILLDVATGKAVAEGKDAMPSRSDVDSVLRRPGPEPLSEDRRHREALIFRSYDGMNVNVDTRGRGIQDKES